MEIETEIEMEIEMEIEIKTRIWRVPVLHDTGLRRHPQDRIWDSRPMTDPVVLRRGDSSHVRTVTNDHPNKQEP
jgi:hypothetical protein